MQPDSFLQLGFDAAGHVGVRTMPATTIAAVAAFKMIESGEDQRAAFQVKVDTLDQLSHFRS